MAEIPDNQLVDVYITQSTQEVFSSAVKIHRAALLRLSKIFTRLALQQPQLQTDPQIYLDQALAASQSAIAENHANRAEEIARVGRNIARFNELIQNPQQLPEILKRIASWINHHRFNPKADDNIYEDVAFDPLPGVEPTPLDIWEKRQARLAEAPNYWDRLLWNQIRGETRETMQYALQWLEVAHLLEIDGIVELGAKLICAEIGNKQPWEVRELFGMPPLPNTQENQALRNATLWAFPGTVIDRPPQAP